MPPALLPSAVPARWHATRNPLWAAARWRLTLPATSPGGMPRPRNPRPPAPRRAVRHAGLVGSPGPLQRARGRDAGSNKRRSGNCKERFYSETTGCPGMWPLPAARPFEYSVTDADVSLWFRSGFVMAWVAATDHGVPGRFCLDPAHRVRLTNRITYRPSGMRLPGRPSHARPGRLPPDRWPPRRCRDSRGSTGGGRPARFR
jgi:hypothetical protein